VPDTNKHIVVVGAGFAGLNVAKKLGGRPGIEVTVIDRSNHHLFQPLLYQVATAGLSPADIAAPVRGLLSGHRNIRVVQGAVNKFDLQQRRVSGDFGDRDYDALVVATGAQHSYFGNDQWEEHAPGLKTLAQATEIRRRILSAFECAEMQDDPDKRRASLTFAVIGGGPTGVELAGTIGEMSRQTLAKDFRRIDPKLTRVILIEGGPRILAAFSEKSATRATRDLESLGVQVWTNSRVTGIDKNGVNVGAERLQARTVLWAAGVQASPLGQLLTAAPGPGGRVVVNDDLSLPEHPEVFVAGDLAFTKGKDGHPLPGIAPVAMQQGRYIASIIIGDLSGKVRKPFVYRDKGKMATIGRRRAVVESAGIRMTGMLAWLVWLLVHIFYLSGFKNRILVLVQWAWSYFTFTRGARLIVPRDWRSHGLETENKGSAIDDKC